MVANLMRYMKGCRKGWWLLLSAIPAVAAAQTLVDPTRPPDSLGARSGVNPLQSIIISPTRRAAIVYGQTVELGEKVGDFRLIEVSENGVVLQGARGLEVLTLFPNMKMNKKATVLPMIEDTKHPAQKPAPVSKSDGKAGEKEEK